MAKITTLTLNANEVTGSLFNQIISQQVFSKNISPFESPVEALRVDGSLNGDTKLYISTDVLKMKPWTSTGASSLLTETPPPNPIVEKITIDTFYQIAVTLYPYMIKRAFSTEGGAAEFYAVVLQWLGDTKYIHEQTLINAYIGSVVTDATIKEVTVTIPKTSGAELDELEAQNRLSTMYIGKAISNIKTKFANPSRAYNENGFMRSYPFNDFLLIWNEDWYSKMRHVDLPGIFNNDGVVKIHGATEYVLPAEYFGAVSSATTSVANARARQYLIIGTTPEVHYFAGDVIPTGTTVPANSTYTVDGSIVCKLVHKSAIPFMSAFNVGTSFFDAQKLRENHWLTFGYNTLDYIRNFPIFTIKAVMAE